MKDVKALILENSKEAVTRPIQRKVNDFKLDAALNSTITRTVFWTLMDRVAYIADAAKANTTVRHRA